MHVRLQMPEGSSNEVEGQLFHVTLHAGHSLAEMLIDSAVSPTKEIGSVTFCVCALARAWCRDACAQWVVMARVGFKGACGVEL